MTEKTTDPAPEGLDPDSSQGTGAGGGGVDKGVGHAVSPPAPSIELITKAQQLWNQRKTDRTYTDAQFQKDLAALEHEYGIETTRAPLGYPQCPWCDTPILPEQDTANLGRGRLFHAGCAEDMARIAAEVTE